MKLTFPRTLGFAAVGVTVALALPGAAHAGTATYTTDCGPNGETIAHIDATNSWTQVKVNGVEIHDEDGDGTADLTTGPGVYSIEWWGPSTDGNGVQHPELPFIVISEHPTVLTIPARTDCGPAATTTTAPATTVTPATAIDMDVDPCVTSATGCAPVTSTPGASDASACEQARDEGNDVCLLGATTTVAASSTGQLPATGFPTAEAVVIGLACLAFGVTLILVRGRRPI
jgi:hypothetical protein